MIMKIWYRKNTAYYRFMETLFLHVSALFSCLWKRDKKCLFKMNYITKDLANYRLMRSRCLKVFIFVHTYISYHFNCNCLNKHLKLWESSILYSRYLLSINEKKKMILCYSKYPCARAQKDCILYHLSETCETQLADDFWLRK